MGFTVNCHTDTTYYTINPVNKQAPNDSWVYWYYSCGANTLNPVFTYLPSTDIYVCLAAPGGKGGAGGGGGGGNIVTNTYFYKGPGKGSSFNYYLNINVTLQPFGQTGVTVAGSNNASYRDLYSLNNGQDATSTAAGGEGQSQSFPVSNQNFSSLSVNTYGMAGISSDVSSGLGDGLINIEFKDGTKGNVNANIDGNYDGWEVSGGTNGSAGNVCWVLVYYKKI
jgi:hypothetical protein